MRLLIKNCANSLRRFEKRALFIVNDAFTKVLCLHPLPGIIHMNQIEKEMIVLSRHQLVEIHEQEPIMVRGDGSQHFVELIDMVEMTVTFIRRAGHCRENDFDLPRTSDIDDGFDVTSKDPELTRIQRTLRHFPADL